MSLGFAHLDPRAPAWLIALTLPVFLFLPLVLMALSMPSWLIAVSTFLVYFALVPALDHLIGCDDRNLDAQTQVILAKTSTYRTLMYLTVPLYALGQIAALYVYMHADFSLWMATVFLFGNGILLGSIILVGHEMGHATGSGMDRWMARFALSMVGYGHFTIEHNRGHHLRVATPEDPASADKGTSIYAFALREIPGVWINAWRMQAQALGRKGHPWFSVKNELLVC